MKLVIVSHTAHYRRHGEIVGWGPTVREIDQISQMFESVVHIAPVHDTEAPESALAYESRRIRVCAVAPAGGVKIRNKLAVLRQTVNYTRTIRQELLGADAVHVRCPANISLIALTLLMFRSRPGKRWLKYAGNWKPVEKGHWSYTLQRWLLRKGWHKGVVTVNGEWPNQPPFIRSFFNPCLNEQELVEGREIGAAKQMTDPIRLIFVGRLDSGKGIERSLQIVAKFKELGGSAVFDVVGDGNDRAKVEQLTRTLGVVEQVVFHGWQPRTALAPLYSRAHLMLLPSSSEGWPKVLSEAMAYGVVPISSDVSSIAQYLEKFGSGRALPPRNLDEFAESIQWYSTHRQAWKEESENAMRAADLFSYKRHCNAVRLILQIPGSSGVATTVTSEAFQSQSV